MLPKVNVSIDDYASGEAVSVLSQYLDFDDKDQDGNSSLDTELLFSVDRQYKVNVLATYGAQNSGLTVHVLLDDRELSHVSLILSQVLGYYTAIPNTELVVSIVADTNHLRNNVLDESSQI